LPGAPLSHPVPTGPRVLRVGERAAPIFGLRLWRLAHCDLEVDDRGAVDRL
jgi:hypothetical protein